MGTPLTIARELLSQPAAMPSWCLRNLSSAATPCSCYVFPFLSFAPTIQLETTPGAPMVALSKALDEADVAISVVIVWRVSMLSARSPF
jgi:hypothetical protein